jgi:imidazoleglycerol-phosphate dehydratase
LPNGFFWDVKDDSIMTRRAEVTRETSETSIRVELCLDGSGNADVHTGIGFLDHMLAQVARHGLLDLSVKAAGDLDVDEHHTVEDVAIGLGKAFAKALGDAKGIRRFGHCATPMDDALAEVSLDLSGRPFVSFRGELPRGRVGAFDSELVEEFFRGFTVHAHATLHINLRYGSNLHHCIEAVFKAFGRSVREAVQVDPRVKGIPSTKGTLEA